MIRAGTLLPTEEDYAALFDDRGRRFADTLYEDAQQLLARARSDPGVEQIGVLGGAEEATAVVVDIVDTLEETLASFSVAGIDTSRLVMILGAFDVEAAFSAWSWWTCCRHGLYVSTTEKSATAFFATEPAATVRTWAM